MSIHQFDRIYCINLDRRADRWSSALARFERLGIGPVIRYPACDGRTADLPAGWADLPGAYGCLLSHVGVVREAREVGAAHVLIFEDDVVFCDDFLPRVDRFLGQVPDDWDMLMLGGSHWSEPGRLSESVSRVTATVATHSYALRRTIYDEFVRLNLASSRPVDFNNTLLQGRFRCYCAHPRLTWQEDGYSDVAERFVHPPRPD